MIRTKYNAHNFTLLGLFRSVFFSGPTVLVYSRKEMLRPTLLVLFATALLFAQGDNPFNRPPAGVDQALRARITEFYQLHVKGDFRHAEAFVAEDTREFYYSHNKPQYLSFEIGRI